VSSATRRTGRSGRSRSGSGGAAIDDPTNFPTPGTTSSRRGAVRLSGSRRRCRVGPGHRRQPRHLPMARSSRNAASFADAVCRAVLQSSPSRRRKGCGERRRPGSIVQLSNIAYYLGEDGFYAFDGSQSRPIGFGKIDKTFFSDLDQSYFYRITSTVDPINKIVYWAYPGAGNIRSGNPNRILAYHWALESLDDHRGERHPDRGDLLRSLILRLHAGAVGQRRFPNLDTMPVSLDSRVWTGGRSLLACLRHGAQADSQFTGANLAVTAQTSEAADQPEGPGADQQRPADHRRRLALGRDRDAQPHDGCGGLQRPPVAMDDNGNCYAAGRGAAVSGARSPFRPGSSFTHLQGLEVPDDEVAMTGTTR
jgi:hypothetical protein